ncbi:MAG: 4Fe-4S binding protein [Synergistaceae bacterium]|nr:4Fe-4S binding protein [Synergistaceae bacterium]
MSLAYMKDVATLELDEAECAGCGMCADVCPHGVFAVNGRKARITDRDLCMECGACALNCPAGAIEVDAGVGCANAIIMGWLNGGEADCDCSGGGQSCC